MFGMSASRIQPRIFIAVGLSIFVFVSFLLYASVDRNAKLRQDIYNNAQSPNVAALKQKLDYLEKQLNKNNEIISGLERKLDDERTLLEKNRAQQKPDQAAREDGEAPPQIPLPKDEKSQQNEAVIPKPVTPISAAKGDLSCAARSAKSDIQMLDAYAQIPFDNPNGGVWKQGFEITYDKQKIQSEKRLEVVVIPHSHCDPGWLKTFEEYYDSQTQQILNGMLQHLDKKPDMKFIYAEMSFFELWWSRLTEAQKEKTRNLLKNGQLEIVTGGWVMTDEANANAYAIVMELIEGHEFLKNQLDFKPTNHWSIDPFGLSSTLAHLIKASNLTHMAVQRVHYSVKKFLAQTKQLEFRWRQLHAGDQSNTDIRTHMFPFYSYDAPHSCGPDPSVCCQFDFRRLTSIGCPWGKRPQRITDRNVAARAEMLADQYRKKAQLYRMNTLLVPLGDDFRYDSDTEWEDQYTNYKPLFDYMNNKAELNIHARFGTLKDYFDLLDKRLMEDSDPSRNDLPILSGDFFTYADRDDHYWSGYYTSRPFYKHMDRTVQHFVRTADILFALAQWKSSNVNAENFPLAETYDKLVQARRWLSLFQHHDAVVGTARDAVVLDYGRKMLTAINDCAQIIARASAYLLKFPDPKGEQQLRIDQEYFLEDLPKKLIVEDGSTIVLHNSLAYRRQEVVCVHVASPKSRVRKNAAATNSNVVEVRQQIQPIIELREGHFVVDKDAHELCFIAEIHPLGFGRYEIFEAADSSHTASVAVSMALDAKLFDNAATLTADDSISLSNSHMRASFDFHTGYLKSIQYGGEPEIDLQLEFLHYGARGHNRSRDSGGDSLSGAYLFLPDGPAKPLPTARNSFIRLAGEIRQTLLVKGPDEARILQQINLDSTATSLEIVNTVDVRSTSNFELSLRFTSKSFASADEQFYTDLNGLQMIRRKRFEKLPIQAQFYPMPSAAFIDSAKKRLSLLGRQALGVASLSPGTIEVILDRRLMQDDDRGLAQGVTDNKQTESRFRLSVETVNHPSDMEQLRAGYLSAAATHLSLSLHYPLILLYGQLDSATSGEVPAIWSALKKALPCDVHLFALRTLSEPTVYSSDGQRHTKPRREASLILQRHGVECLASGTAVEACENTNGRLSLSDYFDFVPKSLTSTSLTGMYESNELPQQLHLNALDLKAIKVEF